MCFFSTKTSLLFLFLFNNMSLPILRLQRLVLIILFFQKLNSWLFPHTVLPSCHSGAGLNLSIESQSDCGAV